MWDWEQANRSSSFVQSYVPMVQDVQISYSPGKKKGSGNPLWFNLKNYFDAPIPNN